jgi:hypothetical protein
MARALAAGVPADLVAVLMTARRYWRAANDGATTDALAEGEAALLWKQELDRALAHPRAEAFDEVFVAAARRARAF